jgi:hypothetical protein
MMMFPPLSSFSNTLNIAGCPSRGDSAGVDSTLPAVAGRGELEKDLHIKSLNDNA